ncbi:MAG TPA: copper resistance protein CopC [Actinomycetota bacterium]|nr:copper resistance protein CopC [Actinomycetota bacterium]
MKTIDWSVRWIVARIGRHTVVRALYTTLLAAFLLGLSATAGWAHTSLLDSTPANLSRLESAPDSIELEFTDPVDPQTVTVRILDSEGRTYEGAERTTPAGDDTTEVAFALPDLPEGTYGIAWQSVGRDGHRAVGEVVFGVGAVGQNQVESAQFSAVSAFDRAVDGAGATGRFLWYLGLSLAVGALFVLVWMAGDAGTWTAGGRSLWTVARLWLGRGLKLAFLGAALRLAATVVILSGSFAGSTASRVGKALSTGGTLYEALVPLALAFAIRFSEAISVAPYLGRRDKRWRRIAAATGLAVVAGAVGGHLAVNRAPEIAVVVSSAHIVAAALWIGPLCILALWLASSRRTGLPAAERSGVLTAFFPRFARAAGWSLLVLVLTGVEALWANLGTNLLANNYGVTLTVKLGLLLVVILPLALSHDQRVKSEPETLNDPKFGRSLRIEIAGLATVLVLASALAVLNPTAGPAGAGGGGDQDAGEALLAAEPVGDVSECSGLNVGQQNCYKTYFSALMRREDAGVAVSKILELSQEDDYVATQCHQITHDLGRDAADYYDTLGEALSFEASACWSGYYHGVVEQRMSQYDDTELLTRVPTFCNEAAKDKYSFVHYNCVHGVGHGIMLRFDADLFESIPYCERLTDSWELSSCVSGAFMQNVVSAQEGHTGASFREGDLVYPCNEVGRPYRDECFGMQTSYILWKSESDLAKGFAICDTVEADFADDCYQSMGRDISGNSLLDPVKVVEGCALGGAALREHCIVGASLNAVFNDHNTDKANELCAIVDEIYREACLAARDRAAASF